MTKSELQTELLSVIHWIHSQGWAPATSTNYSFRNPGTEKDTCTISRSGVDKGAFALTDFMEVDAQGQPLPDFAEIKPSAETLLHTMLYENAGINAVLHTHSVNTTVFSWKHRENPYISISGFELLKGISGITTHETTLLLPVFANAQDIEALSAQVRAALPHFPGVPGFLLAGHGLYAWGSSIAEAKRHIETFEFLMHCLLLLER